MLDMMLGIRNSLSSQRGIRSIAWCICALWPWALPHKCSPSWRNKVIGSCRACAWFLPVWWEGWWNGPYTLYRSMAWYWPHRPHPISTPCEYTSPPLILYTHTRPSAAPTSWFLVLVKQHIYRFYRFPNCDVIQSFNFVIWLAPEYNLLKHSLITIFISCAPVLAK